VNSTKKPLEKLEKTNGIGKNCFLDSIPISRLEPGREKSY
jgi:hypothetical protein